MQTLEIRISGSRLMAHNEQLANPFSPWTQRLREVAQKRKKTLEDFEQLAEIEFQGGLYIKDDIGPYVPAHALQKMLIEGARARKKGKDFEKGVLVTADAPILYDGPRDRDGLWSATLPSGERKFVDQRLVGISKARTLRTRPLFRDWSLVFTVTLAGDVVRPDDVASALDAATLIGLGDGRPLYAGQFRVDSIKEK